MTRVLVTGATGTIGSRTVEALVNLGLNVAAGARAPQQATRAHAAGADVVRFDFHDTASMDQALAGVDRLFLLTPFVEESAPLVKDVLDAAKEAGVEFVVRMSAAGADLDGTSHVARQHGLGEEHVKLSGLGWAIVRPSFFMDNLVNYAGQSIKTDSAFYGAAGDAKVAYVSSRDVAASVAAILENPSPHSAKTYDLTGPEAVAEADVADIIGKLIGRRITYTNLDSEELSVGLSSQGMPDWMVDSMLALENVKAQGWASQVTSAVRDLAGASETFLEFATREKASWL